MITTFLKVSAFVAVACAAAFADTGSVLAEALQPTTLSTDAAKCLNDTGLEITVGENGDIYVRKMDAEDKVVSPAANTESGDATIEPLMPTDATPFATTESGGATIEPLQPTSPAGRTSPAPTELRCNCTPIQ